MAVPQVAIVGRPNVGKSSIFNWLAEKRLAIVDDVAGVTRDRVMHLMHEYGRYFELVDTGGIGIVDCDNLTAEIEAQIQAGIEQADLILFVVDTRAGILPLDEEVAKRLRYVDKPIICVANKTDDATYDVQADSFYKLGRGKLIKVSVMQNRYRDELVSLIVNRLPPETEENSTVADTLMKVAIVGRRNVGKSTFVNALAQAERMIVSEVPGTTRDSVDVRFEMDGKTFMAIDTPGLRRTKSIRTDLEFYSTHRAQRSIRRADVVLMFFDPSQRISKIDKQLCKYITDEYKPCIFVVNKWDLMANQIPTERWVRYLRDTFQTMWYAPIAFITGQTGKNVKALLNHTQNVFSQSTTRVSTSELNRLMQKAIERHPPPAYKSRAGKIYYATQVSVQPPTLVVVCNQPKAFSTQYRRYLLGVLRDQLDFGEVPIKLYLQKRSTDDKRNDLGVSDGEADSGDDLLDTDSQIEENDGSGQQVGDEINFSFDDDDDEPSPDAKG